MEQNTKQLDRAAESTDSDNASKDNDSNEGLDSHTSATNGQGDESKSVDTIMSDTPITDVPSNTEVTPNTTEADAPPNIEIPPNTEVPPYSTKIWFKSRKLDVTVSLQRIPDKAINLFPTNTYFYLDTFKFTKKYHLRFDYPQEIEVDAAKCEVVFDGKFLKATFPILKIMDKATGKTIKKKGYKQVQKSKTQGKEKTPKKSKTQSKEKTPKANTPKNEVKDNTSILEVIEQVNKAEDEKRMKNLEKDSEKRIYVEAKEQAKQLRKRKRAQVREQSLTQALQKQKQQKATLEKSQKPSTKSRKRSVSFGDTVQVKEFSTPKQPKKRKVTK